VKLAIHWPDLLNHDEQIMWKVLLDSDYLEPAKKRHATSRQIDWDWAILEDALFPALRRDWGSLQQAVGDGKSKEWIAKTQTKLQSESRAAKAAPKSKAVSVKGANHG
jgi:DNA mismatch repair protein MutH